MSKTVWTNKKIRKLIYNKSEIKVLAKGKNSVIVEVYTPKKKKKQSGGGKKPTNRELLLELRKDMNYVIGVLERNNLK